MPLENGKVSFLTLFRFADWKDHVLLSTGTFAAVLAGAYVPLISVLLAGVLDDFMKEDVIDAGIKYAKLFAIVGAAIGVASFFQVACFTISADRQVMRLRRRYLDAVLGQEMSWFDVQDHGTLAATVNENTIAYRDAIGDKLGVLIQYSTMFLGGLAVGFWKNWKIALVVTACLPLMALGGVLSARALTQSTSKQLEAYGKAGSIASEAISMFKTVTGFGLERRLGARYDEKLRDAERSSVRTALSQGYSFAILYGVYYMCYALTFWFSGKVIIQSKNDAAELYPPIPNFTSSLCSRGSKLSPELADSLFCGRGDFAESFTLQTNADICNCAACGCGCFTPGVTCVQPTDAVMVLFAVVFGAFALGSAAPSFSTLQAGRLSAFKMFDIIDRQPRIQQRPGVSRKPSRIDGAISFRNVEFRYPTRENPVFRNLSFDIPAGSNVAFVGGSGGGKSTCAALIQRFYDPSQGAITLDGADLRELDLKWLKQNIGLVGQNPTLFATTIAENIAYGAQDGHNPTRQEIEEAARSANAYDFIASFPMGFDTHVGEGGGKLSGGQKQRIAIARALIRNPSILILDEATSALDNESERVVQQALDDLIATKSRTTITIAHRLTTVQKSDKIFVLGDGKVLEQGTFKSLQEKNGYFAALLAASKGAEKQQRNNKSFDDDTESNHEDDIPTERLGSSANKSSFADGLANSPKISSRGVVPAKTKEVESKEKKKRVKVSLSRIFQFSRKEFWMYFPAAVAAAINGATLPLWSILFADVINALAMPTESLLKSEVRFYTLLFVALAVAAALSNFLQFYLFGYISSKMTSRVRSALFQAVLRQDPEYYDCSENSVGAVSQKLSADAAIVKASLADKISMITMNISTAAVGLGIAFYYSWKLTLVLLALLPLIGLAGAMEFLALAGMAGEDKAALGDAAQVLSESIHGIQIVTAFGLRDKIVALYSSFLEGPSKQAVKAGFTAGAAYGFSQVAMFATYSIAFYYGATLIDKGDVSFTDMITSFFAIVMVGMGIGQASALVGSDLAKANAAIESVFTLLDKQPNISPNRGTGKREESFTNTDIDFRNVAFNYPTRPDVNLFTNLNLTIRKGTSVAFVGASGSGKSSICALIERFYDPTRGNVSFHGVPLRDIDLPWLRSKFGFVQQDSQLFSGTIFENIALGVPDEELGEDGFVPEELVIEAAKKANAHDFISSFPDGYQTLVSGSKLSGGQKQRISIARVMIRNPSVLILDEATSALDNQSEKIVQATLDAASHQRTTIIVAHRLSTIENCDEICVVSNGAIVERGTKSHLLSLGGAFKKLYQAQQNDN